MNMYVCCIRIDRDRTDIKKEKRKKKGRQKRKGTRNKPYVQIILAISYCRFLFLNEWNDKNWWNIPCAYYSTGGWQANVGFEGVVDQPLETCQSTNHKYSYRQTIPQSSKPNT